MKQGRIAMTRSMDIEDYCDIIANVANKDVKENVNYTEYSLDFV